MIGSHHIMEAVITLLKADTPLTDFLSGLNAPLEIREHQYQGRDTSTYPAVRVNATSTTLGTTGNCAPNQGNSTIIIYTYSEKDSSLECDQLTEKVFEAIKDQRLNHSRFSSIVLVPQRIDHAQRITAQRRWRGTLTLNTIITAKEVV